MTFALLTLSYAAWSVAVPEGSGLTIIYLNFALTHVGVFALRGIYFALLEEYKTPKFLTGASVGMISVVGFTPDAFFAPITGRILDANPGAVGFQHYFLFLVGISLVGIVMTAWLVWLHSSGRNRWQDNQSMTKASNSASV